MFDGTTVTMPDTPENQQAYPQIGNQKPGLGFPIARIGALTSLACGAIVNLGFCQYAGKGQGEVSLLRRLWDVLHPGDVLLADRLMANWTNILLLQQRGVELVSRLNKANRQADFRRGQRLGKDDHLVRWFKPIGNSFAGLENLQVAARVHHGSRSADSRRTTWLSDPGHRGGDHVARSAANDQRRSGNLYRARWNNELDLRTIKSTMQMRELRCKTPELVHKEVWTHVLAYNLIRTIMAQAAARHDVEPRSISFKASLQTLEAFQPLIGLRADGDAAYRRRLYEHLLDAIATHRVADRPDRYEPRLKKHRRNHYDCPPPCRDQTQNGERAYRNLSAIRATRRRISVPPG